MIKNAGNTPLNQNTGTLPDVSGALLNWFQQLTLSVVTKVTVAFQVVETKVDKVCMGVWQPFGARQLSLKPEGQRKWQWFTLHADPSLVLNVDDVVIYLGVQYRVMQQTDYRLYGYVEYQLILDYTGSGPS